MPIVQDMVESVYWSGNKQGEKFDISEIIARSADNIRAKFPTIVEKFDADEMHLTF